MSSGARFCEGSVQALCSWLVKGIANGGDCFVVKNLFYQVVLLCFLCLL